MKHHSNYGLGLRLGLGLGLELRLGFGVWSWSLDLGWSLGSSDWVENLGLWLDLGLRVGA